MTKANMIKRLLDNLDILKWRYDEAKKRLSEVDHEDREALEECERDFNQAQTKYFYLYMICDDMGIADYEECADEGN